MSFDPAKKQTPQRRVSLPVSRPSIPTPPPGRRRFSRHQRITIAKAILPFSLMLVLCQLWLFTATLNAYLGGDQSVVWPGAIASIVCLGLNFGLLRYLSRLEEPEPTTES